MRWKNGSRGLNCELHTQDGIIEPKEDRIIRRQELLTDIKRVLFVSKSEKFATEHYELALEGIEVCYQYDRKVLWRWGRDCSRMFHGD